MIAELKLKKPKDIELLRVSGKINAEVLRELTLMAKPGACLMDLEMRAREIIENHKWASPAFLDYIMDEDFPYPAVTNLSVNEEAIHGIPNQRVLQNGDVLKIDCGVDYKWLITDAAVTVPVGEVSPEILRLLRTTYEATLKGIDCFRPGNTVAMMTNVMNAHLSENGFGVSDEYAGHGVGFSLHEQPVLGSDKRVRFRDGMVIAVEPLGFLSRSPVVKLTLKDPDNDAWTMVSVDGSISAQYEMTVVLMNGEVEILTPLPIDLLPF